MTFLELVGLVSALGALFGVLPAVLVLARDRAELRELESVTNLLKMKSPRSAELRKIQAHLLGRYLKGASRRASGVVRIVWGILLWAVGSAIYLLSEGRTPETLAAAVILVISVVLIAPIYRQLLRDVRDAVRGIRARQRAKAKQPAAQS